MHCDRPRGNPTKIVMGAGRKEKRRKDIDPSAQHASQNREKETGALIDELMTQINCSRSRYFFSKGDQKKKEKEYSRFEVPH